MGFYRTEYRPAIGDRHYSATAPLDPLACTCPRPIHDEETGSCWKCGLTPTTTTRRKTR